MSAWMSITVYPVVNLSSSSPLFSDSFQCIRLKEQTDTNWFQDVLRSNLDWNPKKKPNKLWSHLTVLWRKCWLTGQNQLLGEDTTFHWIQWGLVIKGINIIMTIIVFRFNLDFMTVESSKMWNEWWVSKITSTYICGSYSILPCFWHVAHRQWRDRN